MTFRYTFLRFAAVTLACLVPGKASDVLSLEQQISSLNLSLKPIVSCVEFKYHCTHDTVSRDNIGCAYLEISKFHPNKKDCILQTAACFRNKGTYYSAWRQGFTYDLKIFEDFSCPHIEFTTEHVTVTLGHLNRPKLSVMRQFFPEKVPFEHHTTEWGTHFYNLPSSYFFNENGYPQNGVILFYVNGNDLDERPGVHYFNCEKELKDYIEMGTLKNKNKRNLFDMEDEKNPAEKKKKMF